MKQNEELKSCPFCGGEAKLKYDYGDMPDECGICKFNDGTFEVYPELADVPPATKYIRADLASQTQGDVKKLTQNAIGRILEDFEDDEPVVDIKYTVRKTIDYINEQGYLRTPEPTTDEKRVMELMAEALKNMRKHHDNPCNNWQSKIAYDNAATTLAEYEKLKGE